MQTALIALLLAVVLALLCEWLQRRLQRALAARPALIWLAPPLLTGIFAVAAGIVSAFSPALVLLVLTYTSLPVLCVFLSRSRAADFAAIALLWFPLEFAAGAALVPRQAQGFLHSIGYGVAILLGLLLFLGFRALPGMKYNIPRHRGDYWLPFAAFLLLAPVLAVVGIAIGFIPPPHMPVQTAGRMAAAVGIIFAGTALPEEILFRSLIQNLLMRSFGPGLGTLLVASLIFGAAHLDNGPQPVPNWRYFILATIAGYAYGKVFQKSSTVLSSATLHMLVDWTKHFFF